MSAGYLSTSYISLSAEDAAKIKMNIPWLNTRIPIRCGKSNLILWIRIQILSKIMSNKNCKILYELKAFCKGKKFINKMPAEGKRNKIGKKPANCTPGSK